MNNYKQHSFDAYCKTILRHAAANAYKSKRRRAARIVPFSCLSDSELKRLCAYDSYSVDKQTYTAYGREVEIEHDG
ncbi:MAG: RNA polymerase subunit sigma-24, partial [Dehalobacterium sp.]